jgi:hypothetical protein
MTTSTLLSKALQYLTVDEFSVMPARKDKTPRLSSWREYQTRKPTEEEIDSWWTKYPDSPIAIITGKISNIIVIDVDTYAGASVIPFPKTFTVKTGNGGIQLYYKYTPGFTISANGYAEFPHVDIRSDGGYVIAPPSVTDYYKGGKKAGGLYEVVDSQPFADFPVNLLKSKKQSTSKLKFSVESGSRNSDMASVIGTILHPLAESKFKTEGWDAAKAINATFKPPLALSELKTTFESIATKELKRREQPEAKLSPIQLSRKDVIKKTANLRVNSNNIPYKDMRNAYLILKQEKKNIRYNEFTQEIEIDGHALEETDLVHLVMSLQDVALPNISKEAVYSAVAHYAYENKYDEAKDWLTSLKWDGVPRLSTWLSKATDIADDEYHRGVATEWFMGIINRIMRPGCVFDYVLVTVGKQGIGKTSLFRILGGPWYKSFTGGFENKDFYLLLRGAIIIDLDEGATLYRSESIKIKSIITQTQDEYRAPYDRINKKYPRRFVFSMSTNNVEPFQDQTGNRRYWVVDLRDKINFKWLEDNREQLFAEGYYHFVNKTDLPKVPLLEATEKQDDHMPHDEWANIIADHLFSQPAYLGAFDEYSTSITDIYMNALKGEKIDRLDKRTEMRIGNVLRHRYFGLEKRRIVEHGVQKNKYFITDEKKAEIRAGLYKNIKAVKPNEAEQAFEKM